MTIYKDLNNKYQMLDYHITHSRLLFRSMKNKNREYNIDVLFQPIDKLIVQDIFNGLEISLCEPCDIEHLKENYNFTTDYHYKIFCLKDASGKKFYINAMAFGIFHNVLGSNESSIKGLGGDFGEEILWYKC